MNIPTDIPKRINPEIHDPISKSVVYSFTSNDIVNVSDGYTWYKFPYSENTYWTNFKCSCYNNTKNRSADIDIELVLLTDDGRVSHIEKIHQKENKGWYDTCWPFPSIKTGEDDRVRGFNAGLYFMIKPFYDNTEYSISLLGFKDLFPNVECYLLLSDKDTYKFVFLKYYEKYSRDDSIYKIKNLDESVCNIKDYDYIHKNACGVRLIKRY